MIGVCFQENRKMFTGVRTNGTTMRAMTESFDMPCIQREMPYSRSCVKVASRATRARLCPWLRLDLEVATIGEAGVHLCGNEAREVIALSPRMRAPSAARL